MSRFITRIANLYAEIDYASRRSFELQTGITRRDSRPGKSPDAVPVR